MLKRPNPEGKAGHFCLRSGSLLFGLAPSGVYPTFFVSKESGELLPHLFTLTRGVGMAHSPRGLFSVALSSPRDELPLAATPPRGVRTFLVPPRHATV